MGWLLYLRFDDGGMVQTYHMATSSKAAVQELMRLAQQRGFTPSARLVESAAFSVGHMKRTRVQTDPSQFFEHAQFVERWKAGAGGA